MLSKARPFPNLEAAYIVQNLKAGSLPSEVEVGDHVDPCWFRSSTARTCLDKAAILSTIHMTQLVLYENICRCHLHNANLRREVSNLV